MTNFLDAINYGYDGYLREVNFSNYLNDVQFIVSNMYNLNGTPIILEMRLSNIKECRFLKHFNWLYPLLSDGVKYRQFGDLHFISFTLNEENDELDSPKWFQDSEIYFAGEQFSYEIKPVDEVN